ncbi:MAG: EF-P beta-lysylation protein EpmB [Gammaproteobacteria bacterium]|nr:EF-P beta-lysylation protein EpmB [Gammaproteobacteria bacterium]
MIPLVDLSWQGQPWQWQLANAVTDANELTRLLDLPDVVAPSAFRLLVPRPFLARFEVGNADDPLLRQVLPIAAEQAHAKGFVTDPVGDLNATAGQGLIQKYEGRVLIVTTGACAINCRYCFRRHFPYGDFQPDSTAWDEIVSKVSADPSIREVILSGGDPLVLSDRRLAALVSRLDAIDHVDTIRVHTRLPIVVPDRVCDALLDWASALRARLVMVTHANHPNEIDEAVEDALQRLRSTGMTLLNQSVLLAGVNDNAAALAALSRRLFAAGVLPYYLHMLDPVAGAAHFDVDESTAVRLLNNLHRQLPGYLVPKLVREIEGADSKVPLS